MNCTILKWVTDEDGLNPKGVILQVDNGDTQYLTTEEYKTFLKNREKNG